MSGSQNSDSPEHDPQSEQRPQQAQQPQQAHQPLQASDSRAFDTQGADSRSADSQSTDSQSAESQAVLGPVAAKGPKRFATMPDLSKIPASARERLAQFAVDAPVWGVSATDARTLASQGESEEVGLDFSSLSAPYVPQAATETAAIDTPSSDQPFMEESSMEQGVDDRHREAHEGAAPTVQGVAGVQAGSTDSFPIELNEPNDGDDQTPTSAVVGDSEVDQLYAQAQGFLRTLVGRDDVKLRDDQWAAIKSLVVDRSRALVVQRTGWGKSAVYFIATALLRAQGDGPTIIISPLLALMRDQISAAQRAGITAVSINSANVTQWDDINAQILDGEVDVLLCSPERLNNPEFRDTVLPRLAADAGLVVIDEAHCISDWGHDFRPDYRRIRTLLEELQPGIPVLATTATANARVSGDIAEQLSVSAYGDLTNVTVLRGGLDRESLHLAVVNLQDSTHRLAWITDALAHMSGSGIVYCLTVSAAQEVAEQLRDAGFDVAAYTGQTDPDERAELEARLKNNSIKALIATSALGMGFDKPDLSFVIHLGAPSSPIAYYQQVGRAGRGVAQAWAILLPGKEDKEIWDYFGSLAFPPQEQVQQVLDLLSAAHREGGKALSIPVIESHVELKRSRLEMMLKVLDVDGAVKRVPGGWVSTGEPWNYDTQRYERVAAARATEQEAMVQYAQSSLCRVGLLRHALDDPDLTPDFRCGRCDNCGGLALPVQVSEKALAHTRASVAKPGIEVGVRKMWPTAMSSLGVDLSGKLSADEVAQPGRAVARIDGLGWSGPLRELFYESSVDGPTPLNLRTAAAQVLDSWEGARQCEGVVAIRSTTRPQLVDHLSTGLARYLNVPFVGTIGPAENRAPDRHDVNSAVRLASVVKRLQLELTPGALNGLPGRKILLLDDYTSSGWTLAVAARLLRLNGAREVYPFVLAQM